MENSEQSMNEQEYAPAREITRLFGLQRQYLYKLAKEGVLTTVSLRRPGKSKGVRLFYVPSVREFVEANIK